MEPNLSHRCLGTLSPEERVRGVKDIFGSITPHYDLLNRILSARRDVAWRRFAVGRVPETTERILDVATGTGDLALDLASSMPHARVVGLDFVTQMMRVAEHKTTKARLNGRLTYVTGDATALPFPDSAFDCATIAFGLRNMPDRLTALREMARVVKPGGKVVCLEMTFPRNLGIRRFFKWYLNRVVPVGGGVVSGNSIAYRYLPDSIQDFLHPDDLEKLFREADLLSVQAFPLTFGLTYMHEGIVP